VYKEAFKLGLFVTENIIDLQSKDNQLTETEKMAICKYHCKAKGVSPYLYALQLLNTSCMRSWGKHSTDNLLSLIRHKTRTAY
jgi:hypothetical protein